MPQFYRLLSLVYKTVEKIDKGDVSLRDQCLICLSRISGLLMNMSHENGKLYIHLLLV